MLRANLSGNQEGGSSPTKECGFGLKAGKQGRTTGLKSKANIQTEQHPSVPSAKSENANIVPFSLGSPFHHTKEGDQEQNPDMISVQRFVLAPDMIK